jgi:hypothetical protein
MKACRAVAFFTPLFLVVRALIGCDGTIVVSPPATGPSSPPAQPTTPTTPITPPPASNQPVPRAISGGTLAILKDGHTAVASDPDQDIVSFVDLTTQAIVGHAALQPGDEPGRIVEDAAGRVHVALRGGGAFVTLGANGSTVTRRAVCPAPRGIAYDPASDVVHVACADGLLATFPAAGGAATRTVHLDSDLRDVVVSGGQLLVSRFRTAEILQVAADGTIAGRIEMGAAQALSADAGVINAVPGVAYRMIALPGGDVAVLHQRALDAPVDTTPGGYAAGGCPGVGIVQDTVSVLVPGQTPTVGPAISMMTVAVDIAVSPSTNQIAIASAAVQGPSMGVTTLPFQLFQVPPPPGGASCFPPMGGGGSAGQSIAVAFDGQGNLVVQSRDPATLTVGGTQTIQLPTNGNTLQSEGLTTFYTGTKAGIACASCHPEAGDDGRVWNFVGLGPRRTQNLRGGVLARAPFHWSGDLPSMQSLATVVFEGRMVGPALSADQVTALGAWIDAQPALSAPPPADAAAVTRGSTLFHDSTVGCTTCHNGPQVSDHKLLDVGTGGTFKVPSLIAVGYRAPYLHTGCAATLLDRFKPACGGGDQHGHTSQLTAAQLSDLVAYLESL